MIGQVAQIAALLLAAVGGLAGIASLFKIGPERRKITAEAWRAGVESERVLNSTRVDWQDALMKQIGFLGEQLDDAQAEIKELRVELAAARVEIGTLRTGLVT